MNGKPRLLPSEAELLHGWAYQVFLMFDAMPYQVGSSLLALLGQLDRDFRDVDVRVLLEADEYAAHDPAFWRYLNVAVSLWGQATTGLPIDFQVQDRQAANAEFDGPRSAIGLDPKIRLGLAAERRAEREAARPIPPPRGTRLPNPGSAHE